MIRGLGMQMIAWEDEFCQMLADCGYWVICYDNRDVGLSTKMEDFGVPDLEQLRLDSSFAIAYTISDMAANAVGLLDSLEIDRAHILGMSMGGMIAQALAIEVMHRVHTLTSIMSSTSGPTYRKRSPAVMALLRQPTPTGRRDYIDHGVACERVFHGTHFPFDADHVSMQYGRYYDRCFYPDGIVRQTAAVLTAPSRQKALPALTIPALVIHGTADPLVPIAAGIDTAESIPNAELQLIEGMGHSLPSQVWPQIVQSVVQLKSREK